MNALVKAESTAPSTMTKAELIAVLRSSIYPGAADASIAMAVEYCNAAGLDVLQKPVHLVPMWDSKAGQMRDVVMPGIGLYRIQASRTGRFAGQTEPEFGPMVTETLGGQQITFPEWARVTVKKQMDNGEVAEFTAKEFWIENYAVKGGKEKSIAPNAMWMKRPRGQIGKCAAAQALRLAFPEMGAQPTAEEMEGKTIQDDPGATFTIDQETLTEWMRKAESAKTDADALKVYNDGLAAMGTKDLNAAGAFKKAVLARRTAIKEASATDVKPKSEKTAPVGTSTAAETNPPVEITFAKVMDMLVKAKNRDALDVAADWIGEVSDPKQRKELSDKYDELVAAQK